MTNPILNYDIALPQKVENILNVDFWVYTHLTANVIRPIKDAVKFTSSVSVYVARGHADLEINLLSVRIDAPCSVQIKPGEVMTVKTVTDDFDASFIVYNERVRDSLLLALHDAETPPLVRLEPVVPVRDADTGAYADFYLRMMELSADTDNPNRLQAFYHSVLGFYFSTGYRGFAPGRERKPAGGATYRRNPLVDSFLTLVQQSFKHERRIEYYAERLGVTSKHLSRLLKQTTGFTASDWIKNYILLEAKVMLKSSTLTMGQIALQLNFPSQSFFAKFFKNATGMSPKQYRNSPC